MRLPRPRLNLGSTPRFFAAALAASLVEGVQTGRAAYQAKAPGAILPSAWEATATLLVPALVAALVAGALFDARAVRRMAGALRKAAPARGSIGLFLTLAALTVATFVTVNLSRRISNHVSVNVTITITMVALLTTLLVLAPLVAIVDDALAPWIARLADKLADKPTLRRTVAGVLMPLLCAGAVTLMLLPIFPATFYPSLIAGLGGFTLASMPWTSARLARQQRGLRGYLTWGLALLLTVPAPFVLGYLKPAARMIVLYRSPLSSSVLTAVRGMVDRDKDGFSPILLGGDCNDHNPGINPGAEDIPGNGIDENCSGSDATPYEPYKQPKVDMPPLPTKPNVIFIVMDALRPDHLHFAGYPRPTSPNLDKLRADGSTWFSHAYTAGASTRFSLATIVSGLDVDRIPQHRKRVDLEVLAGPKLLGERLRDDGYDTVGYPDTYVLDHIKGIGTGFRVWEGAWLQTDWKNHFQDSATLMTDKALDFLKTVPDDTKHKPFFLFLHYRCTHDPYGKNPKWNYGNGGSIDDYDSALNYCDDEIGRFFATLDKRQDAGQTAKIVISDHGESFGEHGNEHHGSSVFEPDVRSLLLMHLPFVKTVPTVDTPVSLLDLYPTLLALTGAPVDPETNAWNLFPLLQQGDAMGDRKRPIFLYTDLTKGTVHHLARGVLVDRLKYVRDLSTNTNGLYDVVADPGEERDISSADPVERARLADLLEAWGRGTKVEGGS